MWEPTSDLRLRLVRVLGSGCFGTVFEALPNAGDGEMRPLDERSAVAVKRVRKRSDAPSRELEILWRVGSHPCCARLLGHFLSVDPDGRLYQNMVLEYMPCTLLQLLKERGSLPVQQAKNYFRQLCQGLAHIHSLGICHRDLKPDNVLVNPTTGELKICDFGSAKILAESPPNITYVCPRLYRAPELLLGCHKYTQKIDVWSAGCILWELLMGQPLFDGFAEDGNQLLNIIMVLGTPSLSDLWAIDKSYDQQWSFPTVPSIRLTTLLPSSLAAAAELLEEMFCFSPKKRPSIDQVMLHAFLSE
ncbi:glycogen synthase kinase 3 [Balamuthia mandrillaris]